MWKCLKCREKLNDSFDLCWNCGTLRDGTEDPTFQAVGESSAEPSDDGSVAEIHPSIFATRSDESRESEAAVPREIKCRDCRIPATFLGQIALMKKSDSDFWAFVAAFSDRDAANLETFPVDIFRCSKCGRLALFDLDLSLPEPQS